MNRKQFNIKISYHNNQKQKGYNVSKKIELNLTLQEVKTLMDALAKTEIGFFSPLFDKLDEKYDMNVEPEEMTELDYLEKIGVV